MSTVAEIESAIEKLSAVEQRELARWLEERLGFACAAETGRGTGSDGASPS